ncbi:hypothetical protein [Gallibacterium anatis]|uniref:hypothetical protein n=1 Tax=Gallibacterium anatis TaxID=750 RepID=UPI0025505DEF|nr:hypothetical protein [Gallibacterium anatis]WIM82654.1 hypothetical protein QP019_03065 [Gallibacterium anatis]
MKKKIKYLIFILILFLIFLLTLLFSDIYIYVKTKCNVKWGTAGIYSDYVVCNNKYITDGVINYKVISNSLLIFSVKIEDRFPRLCFTDKKIIYLYSSKENSYKILNNSEIISINKRYNIKKDFYNVPEQYISKYVNNCEE